MGDFEKLPPQNIEAEQAVLGAILIEGEAIHRCLEVIDTEDFYRDAHRKIYSAMLDLFERGEAIDLVTVSEALTKKGQIEEVGGIGYLTTLAASVPTAANIRHHSKIVKEKAVLRALVRGANEIAERAYEDSLEADELLDYAEKTIFDISDKKAKSSFISIDSVVKDTMGMITRLHEEKGSISGVPSGFRDLDEYTAGFQKSDLIIVGGRPSVGKTAFALNIAQHAAIEWEEPVAIFSLEMSGRQLAMRMLCSEAKVSSYRVRKGLISKGPGGEWEKLISAADRLSRAPIFIDDSSALNSLEMRAKARRIKKEHGLGLIVVDYLQLMRGRGRFERREQEISDISRSLKALAKELDVPVIALSQLNRAVAQQDRGRPTLANLRESGAIEQDADVILFLYREDTKKTEESNFDPIEAVQQATSMRSEAINLDIAKQRNGPTGTIKLTYLSYCTRFTPYAGDTPMEELSEPFSEEDPF